MGTFWGGYVAYQIRYDSAGVTKNTRMKFMTDGILLQEISQDLLLRKYSVIILDEAHERNLNTDVLLGLLSRSIPLRKKAAANEEGIHPLKLVIMSATLRVEDFTNNRVLFPNPPPVVKVSARQYPVTVHFNKRTEIHDYLGETFKKACKVHSRLPEGGILIFLTGQREILYMCNKLEQEFNNKIPKTSRSHECQHEKRALDDNQQTPGSESYIDDLDVMEEDAEIVHQEASGDDEASSDGEEVESDFDEKDPDLESEVTVGPVHVLPLFAMLPPEQQSKVFKDPPAGHRLIVVATNVAETSVTIPGIKYVIDCGRAKSRVLHHETGISQFQVGWVSQASADQRAGRAGRTGPGHCYRLYSTAVYLQQFEKFAEPEVKTRALEDVVLQMKAMGIPDVEKFPFPTAPDPKPLHAAVTLLQNLGAVNKNNKQITALGRAMAALPIGARFSKMVLVSQHYGLVDYALALVATISERDPFVNPIKTPIKTETTTDAAKQEEETLLEMREKERLREVRSGWLHPTSDGLARLKAIGAYAYATNGGTSSGHQFCKDNLLHQPTMDRALQLRKQLARLVDFKLKNNLRRTEQGGHLTQLQPPDQDTEDDLKQILLSGLLDCVAKRAPVGTITEGGKHRRKAAYLSCNPAISEPLYIHPDSSLYTKEPEFLPQWVCYHSVTRSQGSDMVYMVCVTSIDPSWLVGLGEGSPLLTLSDPLTSPSPVYDKEKDILCCYVMPRFGVHNWELGAHQVPMITTSATEDFCARWLARLLLEGKIVPVLKDLMAKKMLNDSPAHITLKKPKKKVVLLVSTLLEHRIICPRDLQEKWQKNKMFLFNYLSMWIKEKNLQDWKRVWNSIEM